MNAAIFCFLVVLGLSSAQSYYQLYSGSTRDAQLRDYVEQYGNQRQIRQLSAKLNNVCPGYQEAFEEALGEMKTCAEAIDESTETACSIIKNHFTECLQPVINIFEECLPEDSKTIPTTVVQSIVAATKYLCSTDGEHVFELGNSCALGSDSGLRRCQRRITTKLQQFEKETPTKNDLCDFYESFRPCFHNHIFYNCGHQVTRETWMGVYDAIGSPCEAAENNENTENNVISPDAE